MGFLNKLFGGSAEKEAEGKGNLRTPHKDLKHFDKMVAKKDAIKKSLLDVNEKLINEGRIEPYHYWSIAMEDLDRVYIAYSMGKPLEVCYDYLLEAVENYRKGWDKDAAYADMLDMVSLGYLLQIPGDKFEGIVNYIQQADAGSDEKNWKPDGILWFIINARKAGGTQPDELIWPNLYKDLLAITKMPKAEAEAAMQKYLDKWYDTNRSAPWYDNHKKELVYKGYWAWEAGAITKIMGLDDAGFRDNPYYPGDLVHWKKG